MYRGLSECSQNQFRGEVRKTLKSETEGRVVHDYNSKNICPKTRRGYLCGYLLKYSQQKDKNIT